MAQRVLRNPKTGETITVEASGRDNDGALFAMSYKMAPGAAIADEHCHPHQEMAIKVTAGTLTCTLDGVDKQVAAGEDIVIPRGVFHFQRNDTDAEVHAIEEYRPALQMEEFFIVLIGWANDGKTNEFGLPAPLRLAVLMHHFKDTIRTSSQRRHYQSMLLAPLGRLLGYGREIDDYIARADA